MALWSRAINSIFLLHDAVFRPHFLLKATNWHTHNLQHKLFPSLLHQTNQTQHPSLLKACWHGLLLSSSLKGQEKCSTSEGPLCYSQHQNILLASLILLGYKMMFSAAKGVKQPAFVKCRSKAAIWQSANDTLLQGHFVFRSTMSLI